MNEELMIILDEVALMVCTLKHKEGSMAPQQAFNVTLMVLQRIAAYLEENEFEYDEEIDDFPRYEVFELLPT